MSTVAPSDTYAYVVALRTNDREVEVAFEHRIVKASSELAAYDAGYQALTTNERQRMVNDYVFKIEAPYV